MTNTKFYFSGFTFVKELTLDVKNVLAPPKQKSSSAKIEKASTAESPTAASKPEVDVESEKTQSTEERVVENGAAYDKNEDESGKSVPNSPLASSTVGSPSGEFSDSNFGKTTVSPRDKETLRYISYMLILRYVRSSSLAIVDALHLKRRFGYYQKLYVFALNRGKFHADHFSFFITKTFILSCYLKWTSRSTILS